MSKQMSKKITPEIIEKAIEWLETEKFICHALPAAMSGYKYESSECGWEDVDAAEVFLKPLFVRDGICTGGEWTGANYPHNKLPFTRAEWLLKIAQELREGKISA